MKQLIGMVGIGSVIFAVLSASAPKGNVLVLAGVAAFLAFMLVKCFVYTVDVIKAKRAGIDVWGETCKEMRKKYGEDDDIIINPAFSDFECNVWYDPFND